MSAETAGRKIVVGVDGSPGALRAVRWAARAAVRRKADLHLVAAVLWAEERLPGLPAIGRDRTGDVLKKLAEAALDTADAVATVAAPEVTTVRREIVGFPAAVLRKEAEGAELLVVGDRGRGRLASLIAGSVAVAVVAHAPCPVVVVRGEIDQKKGDDTEPVDGPVVVGIDGTPRSEAALKFAFEEASARQAPLVAVHTWSDALNDPYLAPMIDWDVVETEEELQLAERLAGWGEKYPDVPVERLVTRGRAASVLLDRSKGAQLVVVGSRGHGEFAGLLLDSVSNALIHGASCPVAIVRNTEES
ncbi:Nucleotide-binding universal stress protein, UspA family [Pseudonocardia thermophila]|jgi:Universal stress protein UspA and related nucleotide-binding proteins|uniref:Nucleotide-binding universal stress protein, UspA family n=1 Tax=Pseudonocardia thermophila TaxID=1848 RepID=A0A1M6V0G8_PSETH|nr:universal stress protein [Pseudonocardia thermophila]SHK74930.1 Nucleotide-binding universal stress protein, UspA family [Pseudonocardia thermophila]